MSVLCKAVVFLLLALPAVAQSQAFEAISIEAARSGDPRNMRLRVLPNADLIASVVPVLLLLSYAYDVPGERKGSHHGRPCLVHRELDRFAGGEPHGTQWAIRR